MEFVVEVLSKHLSLSREEAVELMLAVHTKGGLLISLEPYDLAVKAASEISAEAMASGYPLVCRAVEVKECQEAARLRE